MDNLPKDKLRKFGRFMPDAHVKIVQGDGSYYMGKILPAPQVAG